MIDSGGWYIAYYMGLFHYIFTTYGVDAFTDVYFTGISAGGQTCGYCVATVHGCKDMRYWLEHGPIQAISTGQYGVGRLGVGCYNAGKRFYNKLHRKQRIAIQRYYSALCTDWMLRPYLCDDIDNAVDFGCAVAATGNVPFMMSALPWKFRDAHLWDGNLNAYINNLHYAYTDNTVLFTFESLGTHAHVVDLSKWAAYSIADSFVTSLCTQREAIQRTRTLFLVGYEHAKTHEAEIEQRLIDIGIPICKAERINSARKGRGKLSRKSCFPRGWFASQRRWSTVRGECSAPYHVVH